MHFVTGELCQTWPNWIDKGIFICVSRYSKFKENNYENYNNSIVEEYCKYYWKQYLVNDSKHQIFMWIIYDIKKEGKVVILIVELIIWYKKKGGGGGTMISGKVDIFIVRETVDEMERNDKVNWYLINILV